MSVEMTRVEELCALAKRYESEVEGLELDETITSSREVTATSDGLDGTTYELHERYVRTAGPRVGYARSESANEPLADLVAEAVEQSRAVDGTVPAGRLVAPDPDFDGRAAVSAPETVPAVPVDAEALTALARSGVAALAARVGGAGKAIACTVRAFDERRRVTNSLGLDRAASHCHVLARLSYIAVGTDEMHDVTVRSYASELGCIDVDELAARAVAIGEGSLDGCGIASGRYPVVLSRELACRMLVGIWSVFSANKVATGQSFVSGKLGQQVASTSLTLRDAAEGAPGGPGCVAVDAEGSWRGVHTVLEEGRFVAPLSDASWACELGLPGSSANAGRRDSLGRIVPNEVVIAPGNLYVEPGDSSLDELIAQAGEGVYLTDIGDIYHSFNFASGSVSAPCRGVRIRDGHLAEPIASVSISDNLANILANVAAVGNTLSWSDLEDLDAFWCGAPDLFVSSLNLV